MVALPNHTIESAWQRLRTVPDSFGVDSASHEAGRVVLFPYQFMDDRNATGQVHTPGPWIVNENGTLVLASANGLKGIVSQVWYSDEYNNFPEGECQANARLIAAAPALLEALEAVLEYQDGVPNLILDQVEVAIGKAKGIPEYETLMRVRGCSEEEAKAIAAGD